tara:strand:+ start:1015 stop:1335 length:321 start_codon:yes stop_codon:yes gene_type:complete
MKDILEIVPIEVKNKLKNRDDLRKTIVFIGPNYVFLKWEQYFDFILYNSLRSEFLSKFYRRYLTRYRFNLMIFKKIIRDKCKVEADFCMLSVKSFLFPNYNDIFKI